MRAEVGEQVILFDGTGCEYLARVVKTTRHEVHVEVVSRVEKDRELNRELVLGVALPKGDRQSWLVEKAVELGVRRLVPLMAVRCVVKPSPKALKRLRRAVIETSKQCGRNQLMEITEPQRLGDYLDRAPAEATRWLAHPESRVPVDFSPSGSVYIAVGPEGGFDDDEIRSGAEAGWTLACLGPRILRVETAAIALASLVACQDVK
jgi:16S rRNA (uracil1498-N3)-methyltransferase